MPRAYTKSGSVEKYESEQWATPVWSGSVTGTVTGPDSNGNYTVNAPTNYVVTNTDVSWNHGVTCTTNYAQVKNISILVQYNLIVLSILIMIQIICG